MRTKFKLPFFLILGFVFSNSAFAQSSPPSIYSGATQTNSTYVSQYVPGYADALKAYSKTLTDRYNQNYATYKALGD